MHYGEINAIKVYSYSLLFSLNMLNDFFELRHAGPSPGHCGIWDYAKVAECCPPHKYLGIA
jgi:hypothetical protein